MKALLKLSLSLARGARGTGGGKRLELLHGLLGAAKGEAHCPPRCMVAASLFRSCGVLPLKVRASGPRRAASLSCAHSAAARLLPVSRAEIRAIGIRIANRRWRASLSAQCADALLVVIVGFPDVSDDAGDAFPGDGLKDEERQPEATRFEDLVDGRLGRPASGDAAAFVQAQVPFARRVLGGVVGPATAAVVGESAFCADVKLCGVLFRPFRV